MDGDLLYNHGTEPKQMASARSKPAPLRKALPRGVLILFMTIAASGCVNRSPLKSLPQIEHSALHIGSQAHNNFGVVTEGGPGHNARQAGATGGLVGLGIGEWIAASSKAGSKSAIREIREQWSQEQADLALALKHQLDQAGLEWSPERGDHTLDVHLKRVSLNEMQRRFWRVSAQVTATLTDSQEKRIWKVHVTGTCPTLRSLNDFSRKPELYAEDFREAAADATRQIVIGPIRN